MTMRQKKYKSSSERSAAWSKSHIKTFSIKLNVESDGKVIQRLLEADNKTDYVRSLIEKDIGLRPAKKTMVKLILSVGFLKRFGSDSKNVAISMLEKNKMLPGVVADVSNDAASFHLEGEEGNILCVEKNGYVLIR